MLSAGRLETGTYPAVVDRGGGGAVSWHHVPIFSGGFGSEKEIPFGG